ncbi:TonB-dependent receptor [Massilia pinisoli]|uniref:TonB-dependent receptor n=1 Tax=Massilia pinisoli TaxID=1772194 RepID=A0ABT1ZQZ4_9BURK|nr:TonB-dependent receptor [Massilia pinisoli]MCS0582340.1 TonB-dependent receptor [Massilia pinisoli]
MLKKTVLVHALALAFGGAALTIGLIEPAMAQSNASAVIYGSVGNPAGATVSLTNTDTGLKRTVNVDPTGNYRAAALPAGHYRVDLMRNGAAAGTTEVDAIIGQGVDASFAAAANRVEVTGRRVRIDVSSASNGAVFTAKELAALPIEQSVASIIQLAPNTTRADPRYAAGASMGGGGASENAFYINGFPVTNPLTQLGASELPFGAIAQAQVLTGGFGAEFGRSIGGVMNITTKSGTNRWEAGATASIEPNSLRSKARNVYFTGNGVIDDATGKPYNGALYAKNDLSGDTTRRYGAYVGGPLIEDKLFMFVAAERIGETKSGVNGTYMDESSGSNVDTGWLDQKNTTTRYLGKFDWNITDNHRLEWTTIGDKPTADLRYSGFSYADFSRNNVVSSGGHYESVANVTPTIGAKTNILKYTGNLTDDLTVSALFGKNKTNHVSALMGYDPNVPGVVIASNGNPPGITINNPQPFAGKNIESPYSYDTVTSKRLDIEWKLGSHTLRAGLDDNKMSSYGAGDMTAGGSTWTYYHTSTPNDPIQMTGYPGTVNNGSGPLAAAGYYVRKNTFTDVTAVFSNQSAQYIEDRWQVTKDLLVTPGLRVEQYKNLNGDGAEFLKMNNQLNPRLSAVWDANGDASLKVFGSLGRYSIQIPTHVGIRGASRSTYVRSYYTYTGVGADGQPTGLTAITPQPVSPDGEFGQAKLPQTVAAQNLKPSYQDEFTVGFERAYSPSLNFGGKFTFRTLRQTIDDWCDERPFDDYATAHNIDTSNWSGFSCASINPGRTNDFLVDYSGTGKNLTPVSITAAQMGFEKATRKYTALDLFLEHPMRDGWYGRVNYTWSRSKGNTEGQTLSAVAQTDVAATQTWDMREIMEHANGVLPNDRTHQIKAFGYWQVLPEWIVGGNFLAASGMPVTCLGDYPDVNNAMAGQYGSAFHYCYGKTAAENVPAPQGTGPHLPWDIRLDASLAYNPAMVKGLSLKVDVFNVFNKQTVQQVDQQYNSGNDVSPTYFTPGALVGYTAPRSVKFSVEYNHHF